MPNQSPTKLDLLPIETIDAQIERNGMGRQSMQTAGKARSSADLKADSILDSLARQAEGEVDAKKTPATQEIESVIIERKDIIIQERVSPQVFAQDVLDRIQALETSYDALKKKSDQETSAGAQIQKDRSLKWKREAYLPRAEADLKLSSSAMLASLELREMTAVAIYKLSASMPDLPKTDAEFAELVKEARQKMADSWRQKEDAEKIEWQAEKAEIAKMGLFDGRRAKAVAALEQKKKKFESGRKADLKKLQDEIEKLRSERTQVKKEREERLRLIKQLYQAQTRSEYTFEARLKSHTEWRLNLLRDAAAERGDVDTTAQLEKNKQKIAGSQNAFRKAFAERDRNFQAWMAGGADPLALEDVFLGHKAA